MHSEEATTLFLDLYASIYRLSYRRRNPRSPRPSGEALALLQHLRDSGPLTVTEAARHFDRSQAAISERVQRLIGRGLLESHADQRDRRRHLVWLTERAEELLTVELEVLSRERVERAMEAMSDGDREGLIRSLEGLVCAIGREARDTDTRSE
ncbi:MAG: MarR family transcriptional regulator [bacterium]|nr:MarR family transcriptional regulator [bacterium]